MEFRPVALPNAAGLPTTPDALLRLGLGQANLGPLKMLQDQALLMDNSLF